MNQEKKIVVASIVCVSVVLGVFLLTNPIAQPQEYHNFADQRSFFAVPNFFDVVSNAFFLAVAGWGVRRMLEAPPSGSAQRFSAMFYFIAVGLVSIGSAYYHWRPNNATLVWDRLPMTLGFMSLLFHVIADLQRRVGMRLFAAMQSLGVTSVVVWAVFDDLRLYALVQFGSIAVCVLLLLGWRARIPSSAYLWATVALYIAAKVSEHFDRAIFALSLSVLSGHSLKHFLAAAATYYSGCYILDR